MRWLMLLPCLSVACSGKLAVEPSPSEPGAETTVVPATDGGSSTTEPGAAPTTCAPIGGNAPFAVHLVGRGPITDAGPWDDPTGGVGAALDVYFPNGRVAGAEVVFVGPTFGGGRVIKRAVLDPTLSVRGVDVHDPHCGSGVRGDLVGPDGGFVGVAAHNRSAPSDALSLVYGPVTMCPTGAVPAPDVKAPGTASPLGRLTIGSARPFAIDSLALVTAKSASGPVVLTTAETADGVSIAGRFSLFEATTIDVSGLRDVLGGALGLGAIVTVVPSSTVSDLTLATPPPMGSYSGSFTAMAGTVRMGGDYGASGWNVALAIGRVAGKTRLRVRHRTECTYVAPSVSIVSADGESATLAPKCEAPLADETITLPGAGPYMLVSSHPGRYAAPCSYPDFRSAVHEIDEIAFE